MIKDKMTIAERPAGHCSKPPVARRFWSERECQIMREMFPENYTENVCQTLNRSYRSVCSQATLMGLKKSKAFMQMELARQADRLRIVGVKSRYYKGREPENKGKPMPKDVYDKVKQTMFRKGNIPVNHKPIGTERITKDGYIEIKVAEPNKWQSLHRLMWEETFGPIPKGMNVQFVTSDKTNVHPWNLELRTKAQNMKKNSYHNYGVEIARAIQLIGAINRQINKKAKDGKH